MRLFCLLLKKGDTTVTRNFENTTVLKVKIVKNPKVEVVSYNWVFRQDFPFVNLKNVQKLTQ